MKHIHSFLLLVLLFPARIRTAGFSTSLIRHPIPRRLLSGKLTSPIVPHSAVHLMSFSVGTPPLPVLAVLDTGSDLTWLRCSPCLDCLQPQAHFFDPSLSSSYAPLPCDSPACRLLNPAPSCRLCHYNYGYGTGDAFTAGQLSRETFTIGSLSFPNITFGCGHNNSLSFDSHLFGLVGLGGGPGLSLVSQLAPARFSYCLSLSSGYLNFDDDRAVIPPPTASTPLVEKEDRTFYFVSLERISVEGRTVEAARKKAKGNMFIDTGTTVTFVDGGALRELWGMIGQLVGARRRMDAGKTFYCYEAESREGFPDVWFHFAGGADVRLRPENAFTEPSDEGIVCLAMQGADGAGILGNLAQQNLLVEFDLVLRTVAFAATDHCAQI